MEIEGDKNKQEQNRTEEVGREIEKKKNEGREDI